MDGRSNNLFHVKHFHKKAHGGHIRDGVQRAHFMEMYVRDRDAMGMAFSLGNQAIDIQHIAPHLFRKRQRLHDLPDFLHAPMMVVVQWSMICRGSERSNALPLPSITMCLMGMIMAMIVVVFMLMAMVMVVLVGMVV